MAEAETLAKKRLAIFCDGTWKTSSDAHVTNVVKLAQAVKRRADDGTVQQVIYTSGVGAGRGPEWFSKRWDRLWGGLTGAGINDNILDAYRALIFNYEPGDEIFIFGFSRGATTARSLAGLIRATGMIEPCQLQRLPEAMRRYRDGDEATAPATEESFAWRLKISPGVHTCADEAKWRRENGHAEGHRLNIHYIGVWDTVGSLGIPPSMFEPAAWWMHRYAFHDLALSSSVLAARHAVALDEQRENYAPALWSNLADLNGRQGDGTAYQQLWFPGVHSAVGGGGDVCTISNGTGLWIAEGAKAQGLEFEPDLFKNFRSDIDPLGSLKDSSGKSSLFFRLLRRFSVVDRKGPKSLDELSPMALARLRHQPSDDGDQVETWPYRPGSLRALYEAIKEAGEDLGEAVARRLSDWID